MPPTAPQVNLRCSFLVVEPFVGAFIGATYNQRYYPSFNPRALKFNPRAQQFCNVIDCPVQWQASPWTKVESLFLSQYMYFSFSDLTMTIIFFSFFICLSMTICFFFWIYLHLKTSKSSRTLGCQLLDTVCSCVLSPKHPNVCLKTHTMQCSRKCGGGSKYRKVRCQQLLSLGQMIDKAEVIINPGPHQDSHPGPHQGDHPCSQST